MATLRSEITYYAPALGLALFFSRRSQRLVSRVTLTVLFLALAFMLADGFLEGPLRDPVDATFSAYGSAVAGIFFIALGIFLCEWLLHLFHNAFYFRGLESVLHIGTAPVTAITYETAEALSGYEHDLVKGFMLSHFGTEVLLRAGITPEKAAHYLAGERTMVVAESVSLSDGHVYTLIDLGLHIHEADPAFATLLRESGVTPETFAGSLRWIISQLHTTKQSVRWWDRSNLSKTSGIGREWSYGVAYLLEQFSRSIHGNTVFSNLAAELDYVHKHVEELEAMLAKERDANALLIGEPGVGKMDILVDLGERMRRGESIAAIEGKHLVVLDTEKLLAVHDTKPAFERTFIKLLSQAARAGNLIIVIDNLSTFMHSAKGIDVSIVELLEPYLGSPDLHVVATLDPHSYHQEVATQAAFVRHFDEVFIDAANIEGAMHVLEGIAHRYEVIHNTFFTYTALQAIAEGADRYIVSGVMPDKAVELMVEIAATAEQRAIGVVDDALVYQEISAKTGIPTGPVAETERDTLLHLEDALHARVVGQDPAISAVSNALRRARAGIGDSNRPMGSFLFLGPTGVGKTETAKALAEVLFKDEAAMQRIDMSEFSGDDGLNRLIGGADQVGTLTELLHQHPYTVLLLDEFEKASVSVHDLFLQVLDEGVYTDAAGQKVNARNTLIIATSNAGSQHILRAVQSGTPLDSMHDHIVNTIIAEQIYKPELINRFDGTVIFEPLSREQQYVIAGFMLTALQERVKDRGYQLEITPVLSEVMVQLGYNPEFGARPMRRVLQDVIEEKIATKIISGGIQRGGMISFSEEDFAAEIEGA